MESQGIICGTKQLFAAAVADLACSRRPLMIQKSHFPRTDPGRRLAEKVLRLAQLQTDSGRFDQARSECMTRCYRDLRERLVCPEHFMTDGNFARSHIRLAKERALDSAVGLHLASLLAMTSLQVGDDSAYSRSWNTLLLTLQSDLLELASVVGGEQRPFELRTPPQAYFDDEPLESQDEQLQAMSQNELYQVLPPDPECGVRYALMPFALVVLWSDGTRRDIDLAGLAEEQNELPSLEQSPRIVSADEQSAIEFPDRRRILRLIVYDRVAMRYKHRNPSAGRLH